jgi:hypothetical protein
VRTTGTCFPFIPQDPGYNKRLRAALPQIKRVIRTLATDTDVWHDTVWITDSTPVPCGMSRPTVRRSELAGWANYGYCASHSRFYWGLRLHLVCTPSGMPILWALADPKLGEREVLAAMLEVDADLVRERPGLLLISDKGFASLLLLLSLKLLPAAYTHPAIAAASLVAAAGTATLTAVLPPNVSGDHHERHGAIPTAPAPPPSPSTPRRSPTPSPSTSPSERPTMTQTPTMAQAAQPTSPETTPTPAASASRPPAGSPPTPGAAPVANRCLIDLPPPVAMRLLCGTV